MMIRAWNGGIRRLRAIWLRWHGVRCSGSVWLQAIEIPRNHFDVELQDGVALDRSVTLLATGPQKSWCRIVIGRSTYINRFTMIDASDSIRIGANCMIGPFCYITDHDHGTIAGIPVNQQALIGEPVVIEDDVWIGAHVTVLKGIRIGTGAVVGAGAVVTRDVLPNTIVAGVPARVIASRAAARQM